MIHSFLHVSKTHSTADLPRLVMRCKNGDPKAWEKIVDRFSSLVYSSARRVGLGDADSEDVCQTVFIKLYQNLDRIENPEAIAGWLAVTASREAIRVNKIAQKSVTLDEDAPGLEETLVSEEALADELASVSQSVDQIVSVLSELREKCKKLLTALYLEDDPSYIEIAKSTGIPIGSIGPTRARCIEQLRSKLAKTGYFDNNVSEQSKVGSIPTEL